VDSNKGYCTEAAKAVVQCGFETLGLDRIHAGHFKRKPASGRVMQAIGISYKGCLRQQIEKWGKFEDLEMYGIVRANHRRARRKEMEDCREA